MKTTFLLSLLLCAIGLCYGQENNSEGQLRLSTRQYEEDLNYIIDRVEKVHPIPFHWIDEKLFYDKAAKLRASLDELTPDEISLEMMDLLATLKDGHTELAPKGEYGLNAWFPVRFYRFEDGIFITSAPKKYSHIVGGKVLKIGGKDAVVVQERAATFTATENPFGIKEEVFLMSNAKLLAALGLIQDVESLPLEVRLRDGNDSKNRNEKHQGRL